MDLAARQRLSALIKHARGEESQREFALRIGLSYAAVRAWEMCESAPKIDSLQALALGIGMPPENLLLAILGKPVEIQSPVVAEDVFGVVALLPPREKARLIEMLSKRLSQDLTG
jgi:transcriptional regulator with XRE-family HTH domain